MARVVLKAFAAMFLLVVAFRGTEVIAQTHHVVGGDDGWSSVLNVSSWLAGRVFRVGDKIWFRSAAAEDTVAELQGLEEFISCDITNPIRMYTDGLNDVTLEKEGTRYFTSGNMENCKNGLKLPVPVEPSPYEPAPPTHPEPWPPIEPGPPQVPTQPEPVPSQPPSATPPQPLPPIEPEPPLVPTPPKPVPVQPPSATPPLPLPPLEPKPPLVPTPPEPVPNPPPSVTPPLPLPPIEPKPPLVPTPPEPVPVHPPSSTPPPSAATTHSNVLSFVYFGLLLSNLLVL